MRRLLLWLVLILGGLLLVLGNQISVSSTHQDIGQNNTDENALLSKQAADELNDLTMRTDQRTHRNNLLGLEPGATVGLALGGGGAKGLAHIGVLKALEEAGIRADYVAGSSMGALVGGAYATGIPIDSMEQVALQTDWKNFTLLLDPALSEPGFIDGDRIEKFLRRTFYEDRKIQDLPLP
ncbi:MAG: patatin-like phospholipase family protein, partial [Candidatus Marinimicrobia bacterium]|nr:patatin-like phospholipase family protein [Candidatus Neomarinimicrobiota bacterium]